MSWFFRNRLFVEPLELRGKATSADLVCPILGPVQSSGSAWSVHRQTPSASCYSFDLQPGVVFGSHAAIAMNCEGDVRLRFPSTNRELSYQISPGTVGMSFWPFQEG